MGLSRADLVTIAKRTGYPVREAWGPGHGEMGTVLGVVKHHTGTRDSAPGDIPTLGWLQNGQELGTCCNYGLGRSGTIYCVSERIAYHAGVGYFEGITDANGHFLGIEGESGGQGIWFPGQRDCYPRLVAAILDFLGQPLRFALEHKEWARPLGRKNDSLGISFAAVPGYLANPATINRNYTGDKEWWEMAIPQAELTKIASAVAGAVKPMIISTRSDIESLDEAIADAVGGWLVWLVDWLNRGVVEAPSRFDRGRFATDANVQRIRAELEGRGLSIAHDKIDALEAAATDLREEVDAIRRQIDGTATS